MTHTERIVPDEEILASEYYSNVDLAGHPVVEIDGTIRFQQNRLIRYVANRTDLNDLAVAYSKGCFSEEEYKQFYRDMGYSLCGFIEIFGTRAFRQAAC